MSDQVTATIPLAELHERLKGASRLLVVSHVNPDGDAIGSQLALGRYLTDLGKEVILLTDSGIPANYRFLCDSDQIIGAAEFKGQLEVDTIVALECPTKDRMGRVADLLSGSELLISIDHHLDSEEYGELNWIDPSFSSVSEMLWLFLSSVDYQIPSSAAEQLYTGVLTDTGRFRYANTTFRTMTCAANLIKAGAKPDRIASEVYFNIAHSAVQLLSRALGSLKFYAGGKICALTLTKQMLIDSSADMSDSEGLVDYTMFGREVQLGVLFKEFSEDRTRVSLRSKETIDVARIAQSYGGGGHFLASGLTVSMGLKAATEEIITRLSEACSEI